MKNPKSKMKNLILVIPLALVTLCGCFSSKDKDKPDVEPLTGLKGIETQYSTASEIGRAFTRPRIGWVNVVSKNNNAKAYEFSTGDYRPRGGQFTSASQPPKTAYPSVERLVQALQPYTYTRDNMPVGFVVTLDGKLPNVGDDDLPEFFLTFVRNFQAMMDLSRIRYTLIVADRWE